MSQLTLASVTPTLDAMPASQWAHDIRNALAVTGLHLETLERLSGSAGRKAASAAQAVMKRASDLCNASLAQTGRAGQSSRRRGFDLMVTIKDIAAILEPTLPKGFEIRIAPQAMCMVLGDPTDIYRILFNLVQNAVAVARNGARMTFVAIDIEYQASMVGVRIVDDGPGLPKAVKSRLFRPSASTTGGNGMGLGIARELAERNGATLRHADGPKGTSYVLTLAGLRAVAGTPMRMAK
jgi:signal transduction histidine kinase